MANRKIISISVTPEIAEQLDGILDEGTYMSKSELFRDMLRAWENARIYKQVEQSHKDIAKGKIKVLKSLKSLR